MAHGRVHIIKSQDEWDMKLAEANSSDKVVIVDFTASWCPPCQFIAPVFAALSDKYPDVIFLKVDVDEMKTISDAFQISSMPTFLFIAKGMVVDEVIGANKGELENKISQYAAMSTVAA